MFKRIRLALVAMGAAALLAVGPMAGTVAAAQLEIPAGVACSFGLGIDFAPPVGGSVWREWTDAEGNVVRTLQAGTGNALTFTNLATGATFSTPSNGSVISTRYLADGAQVVQMTGHTILIMYPTDDPAGPSTTLYVGRVTFTMDATGFTQVDMSAGRAVDICGHVD